MESLLSLADAADCLGMSVSGLRKVVERSKRNLALGKPAEIEFLQWGASRIKFAEQDLMEYINRGRGKPLERKPEPLRGKAKGQSKGAAERLEVAGRVVPPFSPMPRD